MTTHQGTNNPEVIALGKKAAEIAEREGILTCTALRRMDEFSFIPLDKKGNADYGAGHCLGFTYLCDTRADTWAACREVCSRSLPPDMLKMLDGKVRAARYVVMGTNVSLEMSKQLIFASGDTLEAFAASCLKVVDALYGAGADVVYTEYLGNEAFALEARNVRERLYPPAAR
ncbi:MAG: hypothetical protein ABL916_16270 [Burkholderiaceae bacterium]